MTVPLSSDVLADVLADVRTDAPFDALSAAPADAPLAAASSLAAAGAAVRLDQLPRNVPAIVLAVAPGGTADDGDTVLRLTEIGFVPGETVRVVAYGFPGREPIAVRVGRSSFALRAHEAALVSVTPVSKAVPKGVQ